MTLDERCRAQLIPEPIQFAVDVDGSVRFAAESLPWRALIDVHAGIIPGIRMEVKAGRVTVTDSAGRTASWTKATETLGGVWVCDLDRTSIRGPTE